MRTEMLASTVEVLLSKNKCVTVPGVGGFLLQEYSAYINEEGVLMPPRMSVAFNADLLHNDGLLASFWGEYFGIGYDEAVSRVAKESADFLLRIKTCSKVNFGYLGSFALNEGGKIVFSNEGQTFRTADYLFYPTIMPMKADDVRKAEAITIMKAEGTDSTEEVVQVRINIKKKAVFRTITVTAIALFALFTLLIPAEVAKNSIEKAYFSVLSVVDPVMTLVNEAPTTVSPEIAIEQNRDYYIIISSCYDEAHAAKELSFYLRQYPQAGILKHEGKVNVFAAKFSNKNDALTYLREIKDEQFDNAWLLSRKKR